MDYHEEYPQRRRYYYAILISVVSAVIGGLLALGMAPMVYGDRLLNDTGYKAPILQNEDKALFPPSSMDYSPVVGIAEELGPTVVGISNLRVSSNIFNRGLVEQGSGSGIIISEDGYIVTNYHVIDNAERIQVSVADGRQFIAEIKGSDSETDLAVLKIEAKGLPSAILGNSNDIKVGELVVAIGNPLGYEFARSVTVGVISAKERNITIEDRKYKLIQTDAAINPGNSGGALVNSQGQLIGINSAKLVIPGVEGMGFAIPISDAKPVIDELIDKGFISRPSLGIWGFAIDEITANENDISIGIYIDEIISSGAAQKAGLRKGDIIVSINGEKISIFDELSDQLKQFKPGDKIEVTIMRENVRKKVSLILGERR